jgi:Bacterial archaeo-eukaryotic release factor family 2
MQRSGSAVPAFHDTRGDLHDLVSRAGTFVSIWANCPQDPIPRAVASRSREVRDAIDGLVGDSTAGAIAASVATAFPDAPAIVLVADESGVVLEERLDESLPKEVILSGRLPLLSPVIAHRQAAIPFLVVILDRRGADLYWSADGGRGSETVAGDETFIRKVQAGGWSHSVYQQRAENTWEETAREVAQEVQRVAADIGARVVLMAADVRMAQMLRKHLPDDVESLVRDVPGSRSEDGSHDAREIEIRRWIRNAIAEDTVAVTKLYDEELGQHDRAVSGPADTLAALRESRVDTLLLHDDPDDDRQAFFDADEPGLVALDRAMFRDLGRSPDGPARLTDVAIRACLLTGAGIRIVPALPRLERGIGAILRW